MKKSFSKIKAVLTAFWATLISFSSKVMGMQELYWPPPQFDIDETNAWWKFQPDIYVQPNISQGLYWVPKTSQTEILHNISLIQRLIVIVTFIVWIISFIRILKTKDRDLKKKRIKNTIIVVSILIIILIVCFVVTYLLKR